MIRNNTGIFFPLLSFDIEYIKYKLGQFQMQISVNVTT